jgi:hypothetical protein
MSSTAAGAQRSRPARRLTIGLSRTQLAWAVTGIVVVVVIALLAFTNLREIYNSQKDFVIGLLASLAGFCFAKAFSRATEEKALELIREAPPGPVADAVIEKAVVLIHSAPEGPVRRALDAVARQRLDQQGFFENIALLERNIEAAQDRISEYYHAQAQNLDFHENASLLRVVLDDLDNVSVNAVRLRQMYGGALAPRDFRITSKDRLALISVRRDLRESLGRRNQAYDLLLSTRDRDISRETWDVFAVMTADMLKANRMLDMLLSQHLRFPPEDCLRNSIDYLEAALRRAKEFEAVLGEIAVPKVFEIMLSDLTSARDCLQRLDLDAGEDTKVPSI